jgi:hypothetical protein
VSTFNEWQPPKNDMIFQYECQVIQDAITPLFCEHCLQSPLSDGLTKGQHAVYTIYQGIKGLVPVQVAVESLRETFELTEDGVVALALTVDKVIIPRMKEIETSPHKIYLNESIRSCINGFSWN